MPVFISYKLSDQEAVQSEALNTVQYRGIQNLISQIAEEKLHLKLDPLNPHAFIQQESYLAGQIEILEHLLVRSDEANHAITLDTGDN